MSPPNLHTLPSEILKAILEEVFAGSQIRIALCEKNDPAVISDAILEHFAAFAHLVGSESPILPWLVRSKRRPQASSPALQFVASALNNDFGPLIVCRRLYQESFDLFWQRTVFVLEGPVTADDLCDWIPELWKLHIAHVQMEGSHVLSRELKGTRGFERLEQLCLRDASLDAPPIIHEIYDQTDQELHEMILLCRAECLRDIAYPRRTMANLAALVPSVNIVMSFPVAVYYIGDYTETFGGWLPDIVSWLAPARTERGSC